MRFVTYMHWLSYFFPFTILKTGSRYNKDIRILEESGKYKLLCNGARESGAYIALLWRYAFRKLRVTQVSKPQKILVLGVAGGTVIHMLHKAYPESRITGVDIDAVILDIGKTHFGLGALPRFRSVCRDARKFVSAYKGVRFDLVVVDIYVGPDVPDFVLTSKFERNVKKLLSQNGFVLINYLRQPGYEEKAVKLQNILQTLYNNVRSADIHNNRFFLAQ